MPLDLPTLFVVSTCITALLGLFLLYLWIQDRTIRALGWWAAAYLIGGFAVALWGMRALAAQAWLDDVASALLFVCCGMIWCGARRLRGRRIEPVTALAGAVVWILASLVPAFADWFGARVVLSSITTTVYAVMTAIELRQDRRNPGAAGLRAVILPALHGAVFLSPILTISVLPNSEEIGKLTFPLFALMTLLYVVGTAFIVVVMAKERSLLLHKTAAQTDPLTGLFNRRGFEEAAHKTLQARARKHQAVTVLMFDLDHFKSINDRYGHRFGDETLCLFAAVVSRNMRVDDVVGRLGGEEFAAILPGGVDIALPVAERVRTAFAAAGAVIERRPVAATVSIGAATSTPGACDLAALIERADKALYRAKRAGRDRVVHENALPEEPSQMDAPALAPELATVEREDIAAAS
jgi:diguanylate cyclase (GGDEF)-like protein